MIEVESEMLECVESVVVVVVMVMVIVMVMVSRHFVKWDLKCLDHH